MVNMREPCTTSHPVDEMEPEEDRATEYQTCARLMLRAWNLGLAKIIEAPDSKRAAYEVAFAAGATLALGNHTMTTAAAMFGVTRAAISKNVADFQQGAGLPESIYQKSAEAVAAFSKARKKRLGQSAEEISEARSGMPCMGTAGMGRERQHRLT